MSDNYDIIIVGAGPAGISTALHLAQTAPEMVSRTLILEKARHPRPKLCGGGILPDGEVVLRNLGLDITEIPHVDVDWSHFDFDGDGMKMRGERKGTYAFRCIRRHEFDAWLTGKARQRGFLIHENTSVKKIITTASGVTLQTDKGEYQAKVVIGADGSNSVVRRAIIPHENLHVARLLEVVTEPKPEASFHKQADSYFDFLVIPQGIQGYVWDFPALENGKPIRVRGIYDSGTNPRAADMSLTEVLAEEFRRHGLDLKDYKLEGHPIRWFDPKPAFSAPRVLLVGDAAGVDAVYGEGISLALGYGTLAARAIKEAFTTQDFSFKTYKSRVLWSRMGRALQFRTGFARLFYSVRSKAVQKFLWRKMGWLIEAFVRTFFIGWAK